MNCKKYKTIWNKKKQYLKNITFKNFFQRFQFYKKYFTKRYNNHITLITSQEVIFLYLTYPLRISQNVVNAASKLKKNFVGG